MGIRHDDQAHVAFPSRLRDVMGHFATGVVVITATTPEGPAGFTCQSFVSLSLDPPLVSFSPARTSTTWPRIRECRSFCVNVLADGHQELSTAFARSGGDKFAGIDWEPTPSGAPRLDGVTAWVDCTLTDEFPGGDQHHRRRAGARARRRARAGTAPLPPRRLWEEMLSTGLVSVGAQH